MQKNEIIIRRATESDAAPIAAVLHAMSELRAMVPGLNGGTAGIVERNLQVASKTDRSDIFVAETDEGEIAGYCAVHWTPFLFFAGGEGYVTELFVRPRSSQKGIGSRLLDAAVAEGRRRGCARLTLLNGRDSEAYRRNYYAQRGWVERERMANFILPLTRGG
jgi:GNAT superfamily N-acetyltransferase